MNDVLTGRDRHIIAKAVVLAIAAMDSVPETRRPNADRESLASLLGRLQLSDLEIQIYSRAAKWLLAEAAGSGDPPARAVEPIEGAME